MILLTTHYMKDVAALCRRVVVITHGRILYDGTLAEIIDRFTTHKIVTLDFEQPPSETTIASWSEACERDGPQVRLRIDRERIAETLPRILAGQSVLDVTVEDVPLEDVIADLFRTGRETHDHESEHRGEPI